MTRTSAAVLDDLERACMAAETALKDGRWDDCAAIIAEQRRLTHELEHALRGLAPEDREKKAALARLRRVGAFRDRQLKKLVAWNESLRKRLLTIEKFKTFSKAKGANDAPAPRLLDGQY